MSDLRLPDGTRLIHIGPQKTGTTTIQAAFHLSREALADHGIEYAGESTRPRRAGWALGLPGRITLGPPPPMKHWDRFARLMQDSTARVVVTSNEDFGGADDAQARRIVEDLGSGAPHIVLVARRLDRILPSQWQQRVRFGEVRSYDDWLREILDGDAESGARTAFWRSHDLAAMLDRWTAAAGPENVTVIIGDDNDRQLLPRTFDDLLALPPGFLVDAVDRSVRDRAVAANEALGWTETELIRQLNVAAAERGWSRRQRRDLIRLGVIHGIKRLPVSHPQRAKPEMPAWAEQKVRLEAQARHDAVARSSVRVVGEPTRLLMPEHVPLVDQAPQPPPTVALETAVAAVLAGIDAMASLGQDDDGPDPAGPTPDVNTDDKGSVVRRVLGRLGGDR